MLTINPYSKNNSSINFGVKIPTRDVISLATQKHLSNDFFDILSATDKMTGRSNCLHDLMVCGNKCKNALLEQFPVLKEVRKNTNKFFKGKERTEEEIDTFVNKQIEKIGAKELDVKPIKIDNNVFCDYDAEISNTKPVIAVIVK